MSTSQGIPKTVGNHQKLGRVREDPPEPPGGKILLAPWLQFLASGTERIHFCCLIYQPMALAMADIPALTNEGTKADANAKLCWNGQKRQQLRLLFS
jgi:hypothetical protein